MTMHVSKGVSMNKKRFQKKIKISMIVLLMGLASFVTFFYLEDNYLKETNTTAEELDKGAIQVINNNVVVMQNKQNEKSAGNNGDSSKVENKTEEKKIQIKINETRLGEETKASVNQWKNQVAELSKKYPDKVILKGKGNKKTVALTFDDGPDKEITPQIIDELNRNNAKGTFFFEGDRIQNNEYVVKRAFEYGNQIAGHSFSHPMFTKKGKEEVAEEIAKTNNMISSCIGRQPRFFRPPYGDIDESTLKYLDNDTSAVIWSLDTFDWVEGTPASEIAQFVIDSIEPEDIVLMHSTNGKQETLKAVPLIIKGLREKGYEFVTVSEILEEDAYR